MFYLEHELQYVKSIRVKMSTIIGYEYPKFGKTMILQSMHVMLVLHV